MPNIQLGNQTFTVNALLAEESFDLQPKLAPIIPEIAQLAAIFSGSLAHLAEVDKRVDEGELSNNDLLEQIRDVSRVVGPIVERVCKLLSPDDLRYIRRTLLRDALCDGRPLYAATPDKPSPINVILQGRTLDMWRLIIFAVKVSYPDFFALGESVALRSRTASPSAT